MGTSVSRGRIPLVMTRETKCMKEIESWEVNDIVSIKGVLASRRVKKSSFCKSCGIKVQVPGVKKQNVLSEMPENLQIFLRCMQMRMLSQ